MVRFDHRQSRACPSMAAHDTIRVRVRVKGEREREG
jgi:hypothetical protein